MAFLLPIEYEESNTEKESYTIKAELIPLADKKCRTCGLIKNIYINLRSSVTTLKEHCSCLIELPKYIKLPPIINHPSSMSTQNLKKLESWQKIAQEYTFNASENITYNYLLDLSKLNPVKLDLRNHGLHYGWGVILGEFLKYHTCLKVIDLANNVLTGAGVDSLCDFLMNNETVVKLDLSGNYINNIGVYAITNVLYSNSTLEELSIADNAIIDLEAELIIDALRYNTTLHTINMKGNMLTQRIVENIVTLLHETVTLEDLNLAHNKFNQEALIQITKALGKNTSLKSFNLSGNNLSDGVLQEMSLLEILCANQLERVDISDNFLTDSSLKSLASLIDTNRNIKELYIGGNSYTSEGITFFVSSLSALGKIDLRHLDIKGTFVNADTRESFRKFKTTGFIVTGMEGLFAVDGISPLEMTDVYLKRNKFK